MPARRKLSIRQLELLVEFAESNRDIAMGRFAGAMANQASRRAWETIALRLNSVAEGAIKAPNEWKRYWIDLKAKTKNKSANQRRYERGTGGGPNRYAPLNDFEKRIIALIGPVAIHGEPSVRLPIQTESTIETSTPASISEEWLDESLFQVHPSEEMTTQIEAPSDDATASQLELSPDVVPSTAVATSQLERPLAEVNTFIHTQAPSLPEHNTNAAPTHPQEPERQADLPQCSRHTNYRRLRQRTGTVGVPQWALDIESRRIAIELQITAALEAILNEVKEIKEMLKNLRSTPSASH